MFNYLPAVEYNGVCNVQDNFNTYFRFLTNKVSQLFTWKGLPDTVDVNFLNTQLLLTGKVCFFKDGDKVYALNGNTGGEPNAYYKPTQFIIANPVLGSKMLRVRQKDGDEEKTDGLDGAVVYLTPVDEQSDNFTRGGLFSLIYQTAGLLADNISSLNVAQINGRVNQFITADDEEMGRTAELVLKEMYMGKPYKVLSQDIVDKINVNPVAATGNNQQIMSLIEAHQYILSQFFAEIGIVSNFNMKRERLNTAEVEMNTGSLDINIQSMLGQLKKDIEKVNKICETSIEIDLNEEIFYDGSGNAGDQGLDATYTPEADPISGGEEESTDEENKEEVKVEKEVKEEVKSE